MSTIKRNEFTFDGPKAVESAKYYDTVMRYGYNGDVVFLAWDSAHKFGVRMIADKMASFKYGLTLGKNALVAAEFIDNEYDKAYRKCDQIGRSKKMKSCMEEIYLIARAEYGVEIKIF